MGSPPRETGLLRHLRTSLPARQRRIKEVGDTTPTAAARAIATVRVGLAGVDGCDEIVAGHRRTARDLLRGSASP